MTAPGKGYLKTFERVQTDCRHELLKIVFRNMENEVKKKSNVASSILEKFQQFSKEKEEAASYKQIDSKERYFEQNKRKHSEDVLHNGIPEEDVGIIKYVSNHEGFTGILKHRFTDFQVHEIDPDGNLVELTSTSVPEVVPEDNLLEVDKSVISEEIWTKIEEILESEDNDRVFEIDVTNKNKNERTLVHKTLKGIYGPRIFSNTVSKEDVTVIKVGKSSKKDRVCWPKNLPQFLHFTLAKLKMDTTHCICLLSKKLRLKANYFTYAGTKDRRAITTQRMCVKRKRAEELEQLSIRGIKIGNYQYKSKSLRLGELSGNKFTITIRNLEAENNIIEAAMDSLNKYGFINYFGLQRFGSSAIVPTFAVGKAILMRNWKLAVELILKPRNDEKCQPWIRQAREAWWETHDPSKSLKFLCRNQHSLEFRVLKALKQNPSDYYGALLNIPRNTLMLYLHSYQSLVWNKIVSRRIEEFKFEPQIGDLVLANLTTDEEINEVEKDEVSESDEDDNQDVSEKIEEVSKRPIVQILTEETVSSASIYDVVYPLPGYDVDYPKNEIGKWYKEILQKDGISEEDLKSNNKIFSLYGTYRKALDKVGNLEWKIVEHNDFDEDLVLSDFDKLENKALKKETELSDAKVKSLIMNITLPPSTYATMVLREVMKTDTSVSFHASLTRNLQEAKRLKTSAQSSNGEA